MSNKWLTIPLLIVVATVLSCSTKTKKFQLTTTSSPIEGGTVNPNEGVFEEDELIEVTAQPNEGYRFSSWSGDISGSENPFEVLMNENRTISANFEKRSYSLNITYIGNGVIEEKVIISKLKDYEYGTLVELVARPNYGYEFVSFSGDLESTSSRDTIQVVNETNITASFQKAKFSLNVEVSGEGEVVEKVLPLKLTDYEYESVIELTPIASEGWEFKDWSGGVESEDSILTVTIDKPIDITANFIRKSYELTINLIGSGNVIEEFVEYRNKAYGFNSYIKLDPNPSNFWRFNSWSGDLIGSKSPEYILMDEPKSITVEFIKLYRQNYAINGKILDVKKVNSGFYLIGLVESGGGFFGDLYIENTQSIIIKVSNGLLVEWYTVTDYRSNGTYIDAVVDDNESITVLGNIGGTLIARKFDNEGIQLWENSLSSSGTVGIVQIDKLINGNYLLLGFTTSTTGDFPSSGIRVPSFVVQISQDGIFGEIIYLNRFVDRHFTVFNEEVYVIAKPDEATVLNFDVPDKDNYVGMKVSLDGTYIDTTLIEWGNEMDIRATKLVGIIGNPNNGDIFVTGRINEKPYEYFTASLDNNFNVNWIDLNKTVTYKSGHDIIYLNGHLYVTFYEGGTGNGKLYLNKYTSQGTVIWTKEIYSNQGPVNNSSISSYGDYIIVVSSVQAGLNGNSHISVLDEEGNFIDAGSAQ